MTAAPQTPTLWFDNVTGKPIRMEDALAEITALRSQLTACQSALAEARRALEFYADPYTYFAIGFFPDPPCGEFMDDFEPFDYDMEPCGEDDEDRRDRPGKRARAALAALAALAETRGGG